MLKHHHMVIITNGSHNVAPEPFGARTRLEILGEIGRRKRLGLPKAELIQCNGASCPNPHAKPDYTSAEYQIEYRNRETITEQR